MRRVLRTSGLVSVMAAVAAVLALASSAGGAATAPTLSGPACVGFRGLQYVPFSGTGFAPGAELVVALRRMTPDEVEEGAGFGESPLITADASGNVAGRVVMSVEDEIPWLERMITLRAYDYASGRQVAAKPLRFVKRRATLPARFNPGAVLTWRLAGFPTGKPLYAHFSSGERARKSLARVSLGTPKGACGALTVRRPFLSAAAVRFVPAGSSADFDVLFSNSSRFRPAERTFELDASVGGLHLGLYMYFRGQPGRWYDGGM